MVSEAGRARPWEPCRPGRGTGSAGGPPPPESIEGEDGGGQAGASAITWARNLVAQSRGLALENGTRGWVHRVFRQKKQQDMVLDGI